MQGTISQSSRKIAFISGGNRGLGFETARKLGQVGVRVLIGSRQAAHGQQAVERLRQMGITDAESIEFDILRADHARGVREYLEARHGRLDILINNAGYSARPFTGVANTTSETTEEELRHTFDINFFGVVRLTLALLPLLKKATAARIVNVSSILGSLTLHADPGASIYDHKYFSYDASKTALNAFTVHLAHELKDTGIKVNSAHPGWVKTEMGGPAAPMELSEGGTTSATLALLDDLGPSGGYFHLHEQLPW